MEPFSFAKCIVAHHHNAKRWPSAIAVQRLDKILFPIYNKFVVTILFLAALRFEVFSSGTGGCFLDCRIVGEVVIEIFSGFINTVIYFLSNFHLFF